MVKKKWVRIKWCGLPSIRYLFIVMPDGQRAIVDHWPGTNIFNYLPIVRKRRKFNVYLIPNEMDISEWEKYLTSELDMMSSATKALTGTFLARILGVGAVGTVMIGLLNLFEKPLDTTLKFFHIPPSIFIVISSFLMWVIANFISKQAIQKKIPLERFELRRKLIQLKFKDFIFSAGIGIFVIGIIFLLLALGNNYNTNGIVVLTILTWLGLFAYAGILRTADLYILESTGESNAGK
ncbi:hypothetical protein [Lactococcus ileimucosae]|uniref:hypothetical protein n=1 Tax=Lactococcus ileimucosae TaxID=2941329 RepID=UPI0020435BFF|nr:hypothetical protein [Lactococcus ileimucosae]